MSKKLSDAQQNYRTFKHETLAPIGLSSLMSTVFHPQTDGASERAIRNIVQIPWVTVQPNQRDWVIKLSMTEFALNWHQ